MEWNGIYGASRVLKLNGEKLMNLRTLFLSGVIFSAASARASESCPIGPKDDHLTVHQVMKNFGEYTLKADQIADLYSMPGPVVNDDQLNAAIADLKVAKACVEAVLANPTGDLLPDAAKFLAGTKREKLLNDYVSFMSEFRDELFYLQREIEKVLTESPGQRDLKDVHSEYQELENLVNRAHDTMGRESSYLR
jgi:hypothetical protein